MEMVDKTYSRHCPGHYSAGSMQSSNGLRSHRDLDWRWPPYPLPLAGRRTTRKAVLKLEVPHHGARCRSPQTRITETQ